MDGGTDFQTTRRNDVGALAIGVANQSNVRSAVGVVFDAFNFGRYAILDATEVDHAVVVLVTTAFVAGGDVTIVVATRFLELWFQQGCKTWAFEQMVTRDLDHTPLTG